MPTNAPPRILIIDDDAALLRAWTRLLGRRYEVATAEGGEAGIALALAPGSTWEAIFVDLAMPRVDGVAFYEIVVKERPALADRVVFLTGGMRNARFTEFLERTARPQVMKPATVDDLEAAIAALRSTAG